MIVDSRRKENGTYLTRVCSRDEQHCSSCWFRSPRVDWQHIDERVEVVGGSRQSSIAFIKRLPQFFSLCRDQSLKQNWEWSRRVSLIENLHSRVSVRWRIGLERAYSLSIELIHSDHRQYFSSMNRIQSNSTHRRGRFIRTLVCHSTDRSSFFNWHKSL